MEDSAQKYLIRDAQGNVYGPADAALLREWVGQGRIVAGMFIAERETRQWVEAAVHPAVADLLRPRQPDPAAMPTSTKPVNSANPAARVTIELRAAAGLAQPVPAPAPDVHAYQSTASAPRHNILGLIAFIASLVGAVNLMCVPFCACVAMPFSALFEISAVALGAIALHQMKANPPAYSGRGLAMAGLVIGICVLVLYGVGTVAMLIYKLTH